MAKEAKKCENCGCWTRDYNHHFQGECTYLTNLAQYVVTDATILSITKVRTDSQGVCKHHINK
jgi:hypothetical protein